MGLNCPNTRDTSKRQFTFYLYLPRNSWHPSYRPRKDKKLSWPWSLPELEITRALETQDSAQSLLQKIIFGNSFQNLRKSRYQSSPALSNFPWFSYFLPNILSLIVETALSNNFYVKPENSTSNSHFNYCLEIVQIRSFFWCLFFCIRTESRKIRTRKTSVIGHFPSRE